MLLSLVLYCYCKGVRSTRKIEAARLDDVGCRIITGNQQVDHATVARFLCRHREGLKALFVQVLALCARRGLVDLSAVAVDGSPIHVAAARSANRSLNVLETVIIDGEAVRNLSVSRQGFLMRARMRLYAARGETSPALAAAEQAVECFAGRGLDLDLCRTMAAAGTVLVDAGRTDDARAWLGRAAALAEQCGSARLVDRVRRQQSRLVPDASTRDSDPLAVLTERERQIADLVSRGMTSVEVAHGLFLSVRTVDSHLGRIYRKLGVSNRASLARAVLRSHTTTPAGEPR